MKKIISKIIFRIIGWKIIGQNYFPKKCVVIAAPHTSNWDFFIGKLYGYIIGLKANYLIKSSFFLPILSFFIRKNGGIPVHRDKNYNLVEQVVNNINKQSEFVLALSPEGTRSRVEKWKTGFYYIALEANIEIVLVGLDFGKKEIGTITSFKPSGNIEEDMIFIRNKFKHLEGKIPSNFCP